MYYAEMDELRQVVKGDISELSKKLDMVLGGMIREDSEVHHIPNSCNYCGDPLHYVDSCPDFYYERVNGQNSCTYCGDPSHSINECLVFHDGCTNEVQGFTNYNENVFSDSYNPGWSEQPDFSWESQHESHSSQPSFQSQYHSGNYHLNDQNQYDNFSGSFDNNNLGSSSLENQMQDMMSMMMEQMQYTNSVTQSVATLKTKVSQLTEQLIEIDEGIQVNMVRENISDKFVDEMPRENLVDESVDEIPRGNLSDESDDEIPWQSEISENIDDNQKENGEKKDREKTIEAPLELELELVDLDEPERLVEPVTIDQPPCNYEEEVSLSLAQEPSKKSLDQPSSLELNIPPDYTLRPILKDLTLEESEVIEDSIGPNTSQVTHQTLIEPNKPLRELNPSWREVSIQEVIKWLAKFDAQPIRESPHQINLDWRYVSILEVIKWLTKYDIHPSRDPPFRMNLNWRKESVDELPKADIPTQVGGYKE